jgi:hypothetical protein
MSRFVLVLTILTVAALTAACQRGAASRTPQSARWVSMLCSSQADVVTLNAGPSKDDTTAFAQWKRGDGSRAFALPPRVQNLQKIYLEANNCPQGRETEMCVKFDNRPKKRMSFSKSENHTIVASSGHESVPKKRCTGSSKYVMPDAP